MHWEIFDFCYNRLKFVKDIGSWTYLLGLISKEKKNSLIVTCGLQSWELSDLL